MAQRPFVLAPHARRPWRRRTQARKWQHVVSLLSMLLCWAVRPLGYETPTESAARRASVFRALSAGTTRTGRPACYPSNCTARSASTVRGSQTGSDCVGAVMVESCPAGSFAALALCDVVCEQDRHRDTIL